MKLYIINTKTHFYTMKIIENHLAYYSAKCCNIFIEIFCFAHYDNFSKRYISILQDKSNFLVLYHLTNKSNSK